MLTVVRLVSEATNKIPIFPISFIMQNDNSTENFIDQGGGGGGGEEDTDLDDWTAMRISGTQRQIVEINVFISSISLVISFIVYSLLPKLRTVPGKCLMGLIISEFFCNILWMITKYFEPGQIGCITIAILLHYFLLTITIWTNLIALDLLKKIRRGNAVLHGSLRNFLIAFLSPLLVISLTMVMDFGQLIPNDSPWNAWRPHYGTNECLINTYTSHLIFVTIPMLISSGFNFAILILAMCKIRQETYSIERNSIEMSSDLKPSFVPKHTRFVWYIKLSVLLGVVNFLAFFITTLLKNCPLGYFISLMIMTSHGTWIFLAFICKKTITRLLWENFCSGKRISPNHKNRNKNMIIQTATSKRKAYHLNHLTLRSSF